MTARLRPTLFILALGITLVIASLTGSAQQTGDEAIKPGEFHFARMIYADQRGYGGFRRGFGRGWWRQDWPRAEAHFLLCIRRLTGINAGDPVTVALTDDQLFDYPWLYATQVGYWNLNDEEITRLREYLLRGGFLMADDFWGENEHAVFMDTMRRLFPDRPVRVIQGDDPVLHVFYTIDKTGLYEPERAATATMARHL